MSGESVLDLRDLSLGYGNPIFTNVTLSLKKGETVSILGENGVGKTLLFNATLGLRSPLKGNIFLFGVRINSSLPKCVIAKTAWVAALAEDVPLGLHVETFLRHSSYFYPSWDWDIVSDLADKFKLNLKKDASRLSLGESLKLRLLRALATRPQLLILDELTGNLSPASKIVVIEALVQRMVTDSISVLNFSHYQDEAFRLSDSVKLLTSNGLVSYDRKEF